MAQLREGVWITVTKGRLRGVTGKVTRLRRENARGENFNKLVVTFEYDSAKAVAGFAGEAKRVGGAYEDEVEILN
jgi:hypothetical protein